MQIVFNRKNIIKIAISLVILLGAAVFFNALIHHGMERRVFIFPVSGSNKNKKEIRYLCANPVQGRVKYYVDELVLGPSFYWGRPLFSLGTKVDYCFQNENILYVGLSGEAVLQDGNALELSHAAELFKKNIKKNFSSVKNIELFVDGNFIAD